jgi:hypothetical protein
MTIEGARLALDQSLGDFATRTAASMLPYFAEETCA